MQKRISLDEAQRAIYVDFEGVMNAAPVLLGAFWVDDLEGEHFVQYVFDPILKTAAEAKSFANDGECVYLPTMEEALEKLCAIAEREDRLFVEWSIREEEAVREAAVAAAVSTCFASRVRNGLPMARQWKNRLHPKVEFPKNERGRSNTLTNFMAFMGMPAPSHLKPAASRIREVSRQITRGGSYEAITGVAKAKWTKLLQHNKWDCRGTRHVLMGVCEELGKAA